MEILGGANPIPFEGWDFAIYTWQHLNGPTEIRQDSLDFSSGEVLFSIICLIINVQLREVLRRSIQKPLQLILLGCPRILHNVREFILNIVCLL